MRRIASRPRRAGGLSDRSVRPVCPRSVPGLCEPLGCARSEPRSVAFRREVVRSVGRSGPRLCDRTGRDGSGQFGAVTVQLGSVEVETNPMWSCFGKVLAWIKPWYSYRRNKSRSGVVRTVPWFGKDFNQARHGQENSFVWFQIPCLARSRLDQHSIYDLFRSESKPARLNAAKTPFPPDHNLVIPCSITAYFRFRFDLFLTPLCQTTILSSPTPGAA